MKTAIIIVNYRTPWHLKLCLESVFQYTENFHLILVQNKPDRKSQKLVEEYKSRYPNTVEVINHDKNLGFVAGVNSAYESAIKYERVCLLNSDTIVTKGWLAELNRELDNNPNAIQISPDSNAFYATPKLWRLVAKLPFGLKKLSKLQAALNPPHSKEKHGYRKVDEFWYFPGGFCNVFRTEPLKNLGYFCDPNIVHGYWDDFDLSFYLRQFGEVGSTNKAYVFHFVNVSFNKISEDKKGMKDRLMQLNGLYVMDKWRDRIISDLNKIDKDRLLEQSNHYVLQMVYQYFALTSVNPELTEYIRSLPAKEIGEKFLK